MRTSPRTIALLVAASSLAIAILYYSAQGRDGEEDASSEPTQQRELTVPEPMSAKRPPPKAPEMGEAVDTQQMAAELAAGGMAARDPEPELHAWMDEALDGGQVDQSRTTEVKERLEETLATHPWGIQLERVDCTTRFCRAVFVREDGEPPTVFGLFRTGAFGKWQSHLSDDQGHTFVRFILGKQYDGGPTYHMLKREATAAMSPP